MFSKETKDLNVKMKPRPHYFQIDCKETKIHFVPKLIILLF